jgi:hypothetical protein
MVAEDASESILQRITCLSLEVHASVHAGKKVRLVICRACYPNNHAQPNPQHDAVLGIFIAFQHDDEVARYQKVRLCFHLFEGYSSFQATILVRPAAHDKLWRPCFRADISQIVDNELQLFEALIALFYTFDVLAFLFVRFMGIKCGSRHCDGLRSADVFTRLSC